MTTMEEQWEGFRDKYVDRSVTEPQMQALKFAFYVGASRMFTLFLTLDQQLEEQPEEQVHRSYEALRTEINHFILSYGADTTLQ